MCGTGLQPVCGTGFQPVNTVHVPLLCQQCGRPEDGERSRTDATSTSAAGFPRQAL